MSLERPAESQETADFSEHREAQTVDAILSKIPHHRDVKKFAFELIDVKDVQSAAERLSKNPVLNGLDISVKDYNGKPHIRVSWEGFPSHPTIFRDEKGELYIKYGHPEAGQIKIEERVDSRLLDAIFH